MTELKRQHPQAFISLQRIANAFDCFTDSDLCMNFLFENFRTINVLIVDGGVAEEIAQIIHDTEHLHSIFIFDRQRTRDERSIRKWPKIKGVWTDIDQLCQAIEETFQPKPDRSESIVRRRSTTTEQPKRIDLPDVHEDIIEPTDNSSPLFNSLRPATTTQNDASASDDLERTLISTATQRISLLNTSINANTIDHLQHTLVPIIEKYATREKDDSQVLNHLFADLKQILVDTIVQQQQQPVLSQEVIRQTVLDVLKEQKKSNIIPDAITTEPNINQRKAITLATPGEIKISADLKKTRVDTAFRRERDAVVNNKRLRDAVQQWTSIRSMVDLVTTISKHGKTNLEYAWLLFCWIGMNIRYRLACNNNSAETVFRTREGVCRGFVSLYHECCSLLNIQCFEISGFARQTFLKSSERLNQSPHAWNSIILDGYTYLVDPTWGAGGGDNEHRLEDFYFLTSPEEFIYTHYTNGNQLLQPELTRDECLQLPVVQSAYYRLGLTLLSPKQGFNEIDKNLFKIVIRAPEQVDLFVALKVDNIEYPRTLHTLCQRDENQADLYNCYITPPMTGLYEVSVYAKTHKEQLYQQTISMRLRVSNMIDAFTFPLTYSAFTEHHCILIEPLRRLVYKNEEVLIHMIIPHANVLKIDNGDDRIVPTNEEYRRGILRRKVRVQGDLKICARWNDNADTIEILCVFNLI